MKLNESKRLWIFALAVLLVPVALNHALPSKRRFNPQPLARLRATQPQVVLIGDSMVHAAIDPALLQKQLGSGPVEMIWHGGASSAAWYLILKNYVVASRVRPRSCCIFFYYDLLTNATFRTTATYRGFLESLMHRDEPIMRLVLGGPSFDQDEAEQLVTWLYPLNDRRHHYQERISRFAFRMESSTGPRIKGLPRRVNEIFDVARLRQETLPKTAAAKAERTLVFDPDPKRSFLPHIIDCAARAGLPLCFVRVKVHPGADGRVAQSAELIRYTAQLRAYIERRGCAFIDATANPQLTSEMYLRPDDDHIGPWAKERTTEIYAEELRPLLRR